MNFIRVRFTQHKLTLLPQVVRRAVEEALYNLFHVKQIVLSSFKVLKAVLLRKHIISSTLHFNMYCFAYAFEIINYFGIRETLFLNLKNF